jgi:predicted house-cleaning noncanonical NTP pyrophosphatase (MazG superfamily)
MITIKRFNPVTIEQIREANLKFNGSQDFMEELLHKLLHTMNQYKSQQEIINSPIYHELLSSIVDEINVINAEKFKRENNV